MTSGKKEITLQQAVFDWEKQTSEIANSLYKQSEAILQEYENTEKVNEELTNLESALLKAEMFRDEMDQKLTILEAQQGELQRNLDELEKLAAKQGIDVSNLGSPSSSSADEGTLAYGLAGKINEDTKKMQRETTQLVEKVNRMMEEDCKENSEALEEMITLMTRHLAAIQWINSRAEELQRNIGISDRSIVPRTAEPTSTAH